MSKKKRRRKDQVQAVESFAEAIAVAQEDALEFLETATPLDLSVALAELGVTTSHRAGIENFLSSWRPSSEQPRMQTPFEALVVRWLSEIEQKRGPNTVDMEDDILLVELARFFWFRLNQDTLQTPYPRNIQELSSL